MRKFRLFWLMMAVLSLSVACKKQGGDDDDNGDDQTPGHVELYLQQSKVYDKEAEVGYSGVSNALVINSEVSNPDLQGEILNVPAVGQTLAIDPDADNVQNSGGSYVALWGNFPSPDGRVINALEAQTGTVSRTSNNQLEAQGTCLCLVNQMDTVSYSFHLKLKINNFD